MKRQDTVETTAKASVKNLTMHLMAALASSDHPRQRAAGSLVGVVNNVIMEASLLLM